MPFSAGLIEEIEKLKPELRGVFIELLKEIERDREESITRKEFREFVEHITEEGVGICGTYHRRRRYPERIF